MVPQRVCAGSAGLQGNSSRIFPVSIHTYIIILCLVFIWSNLFSFISVLSIFLTPKPLWGCTLVLPLRNRPWFTLTTSIDRNCKPHIHTLPIMHLSWICRYTLGSDWLLSVVDKSLIHYCELWVWRGGLTEAMEHQGRATHLSIKRCIERNWFRCEGTGELLRPSHLLTSVTPRGDKMRDLHPYNLHVLYNVKVKMVILNAWKKKKWP